MARSPVLRACALALAAGLWLAACSRERSPDAGLPPGALLLARTASLQRWLTTATRLEGTPLARQARALASRLPACEWVEARAETAAGLANALACGDPGGELSALHRACGAHDAFFALPVGASARLVGSAEVERDGTLALSLVIPDGALSGPAGFLLPGDGPAGAPVLSGREQLAHARVRVAGRLDLASFVPADSQGARLFHLESALFSGLVLDGTWEAAVYLPEPGHAAPLTALALGVRERAAAVAAMEGFLRQIGESWPVHRSEFSIGGASGACLLDLHLLPDLAPCYVATERALVAGWNQASLRRALDGGGEPSLDAGAPGALVLDLARMEEADARLRARAPAGTLLLPAQPYPWNRLSVSGERGPGGVRLELRLAARQSA